MQNRNHFKSPFCPRPVPVLMYHHINPHKGDMVTITPEVFEGQIQYLYNAGYKTLTIDELMSYINGDLPLQQKAVVVTFDDGWLDNYIYAFPVLKKYNIHAAIFIITDRTEMASNIVKSQESESVHSLRSTVNKSSAISLQPIHIAIPPHKESKKLIANGQPHKVVINWDMAKEMQDSGLVEFYSHTKSHAKCDAIDRDKLLAELSESKKIIEKRLGKPCPYLCWPYGKYDDNTMQTAKDMGYKAIFTTDHGIVKKDSDPFAIKRIVVKDSITWFKRRMLIYTNPILSEFYLKIKKK